jgi:UDP-3-O-[3-hydroxymyristoyl] glucosamine N-acyltransferase
MNADNLFSHQGETTILFTMNTTFLRLDAIAQALVHSEEMALPATEMGFVWSPGTDLLTFVTSQAYLDDAVSRPNVKAVLVDPSVDTEACANTRGVRLVKTNFVKLNFYRLHNSLREFVVHGSSSIDPSARVHPTALIDPIGVEIGPGVLIEPFVTIEAGTRIGANSIIRTGCRIGTNAMDIKDDEQGNPYMTDHLGGVIIGENVEVGYSSVVDRAIWRHTDTVIGDHTKTSCHVNVSHGVHLGKRNKLAAGVKICGSTFVGDDNWFGPGAIASNLLHIGSRNFVALGASVLTDLGDEAKVVGTRIFKDRKLF